MNVLIVNAILIGDNNATGVTMENMLLHMEGVNYLQFCIDYQKKNHEEAVDTIYLATNDSISDYLINVIKTRKNSGPKSATRQSVVTSAKKDSALGEVFRGFCDALPCRISSENLAIIRDFSPQLIYTMGANIRVMRIARKLSDYFSIPIVFHCMDDWRATKYMRSALSTPFNHMLRKEISEINRRSVVNLGICKKMANFYACEYQKPYSFASNCVFEFNRNPYCPNSSGTMKIIFSGGLHFHRGDKLRQVGELIERLNIQGYHIILNIYAPKEQAAQYARKYEELQYTNCFPYVDKSRKMENLMSADILLHVESDDEADKKHMKYSFSTKLVEYFAAARAVVGFGDKQLSSIEYIEDMKCGLTAENIDELERCFLLLYSDLELRKKYAENSLNVAISCHSQKAVQRKILNVFETSIGENREKD